MLQYYSEQLTFSVQPGVSTISLWKKGMGVSPAHFSWPRAACWEHFIQNYFVCRQTAWRFSRISEVKPVQSLLSDIFLVSPLRPWPTPSCFMVRLRTENHYLFPSPFYKEHNFMTWEYTSLSLWATQTCHSHHTTVPDIGFICKLKKKWVWNWKGCVILGKLLNFSGL